MGQTTIDMVKDIVDECGYYEPKEGPLKAAISYIEKTYPVNESKVKKAFEATIEGRTGVELKNTFSVKEIIRVMNAYQKTIPKPYEQKEDEPPTPTELDMIENEFKQALVREFNKYKVGKEYSLTPGYVYFWLEQKGLIKMGFAESAWVQQRATQIAKAQIKGDLGTYKSKNILAEFEMGTLKGDNKAIFHTKCQAVALNKYFDELIEKNIDFEKKLSINIK